ncbi:TolC family protein [soil metagenome]
MKVSIVWLVVFIMITQKVLAQSAQQQVLTLDNFIDQVKKYHPIARQADIQIDKANAELLAARGNFDPFFQFDASNKTFGSKNYYYYNNPELSMPLPVGNVKAGLEQNCGNFLSSEISSGKTSYLGVEMPLAKGLLMDKRRATLQQAKIFTQQSAQERLIVLNNLLFESYIAYWQWSATHQQYLTYSKFVEIADKRLRLVRIAFTNGDRALIDTTEAFTQFQNYQLMQMEAMVKWKNAAIELSNYLWKDNDSFYLLEETVSPGYFTPLNDMADKNITDLIKQSTVQNPALKLYDYKLSSLEIERKLKRQNLLPYFTVKANLLNKNYNVFKGVNAAFIENNYKWGVDFKIPLFLREARGEYKKVQLKIKETNIELQYKRQQTDNKIRTYLNEYTALKQQLQTLQNMYNNYQQLLKSEEIKFEQGESSLFLINSREIKLIETLQKQIEVTNKFYKAKYAVEWAAGLLK